MPRRSPRATRSSQAGAKPCVRRELGHVVLRVASVEPHQLRADPEPSVGNRRREIGPCRLRRTSSPRRKTAHSRRRRRRPLRELPGSTLKISRSSPGRRRTSRARSSRSTSRVETRSSHAPKQVGALGSMRPRCWASRPLSASTGRVSVSAMPTARRPSASSSAVRSERRRFAITPSKRIPPARARPAASAPGSGRGPRHRVPAPRRLRGVGRARSKSPARPS